MPRVKINVSLSFIVYLFLLIWFGKGIFLLTYLLVLFIHEYAHAYVAYKIGYKLNNITLIPFGVCLNIDNNTIDCVDSIKIALAGPAINLILAIVCLAIWWLYPSSYSFLQIFFEANVATCTFNMLPCYPLDGGRIFKEILKVKKPKIIFGIINSSFALLFVALFFWFNFNISFLLIGCFLFMSVFSFSKQRNYDHLLYSSKVINNIIRVKNYVVSCNLPLFKLVPKLSQGFFTIFIVVEENKVLGKIYENQLKDIFEKLPPTTLLKTVVFKT